MEVKRCKEEAAELEERLETQISSYEHMHALWNEFDASLVRVKDVHLGVRKIAGVRVPLLDEVEFDIRPFSLFCSPKWYADGIHLLKNLPRLPLKESLLLLSWTCWNMHVRKRLRK